MRPVARNKRSCPVSDNTCSFNVGAILKMRKGWVSDVDCRGFIKGDRREGELKVTSEIVSDFCDRLICGSVNFICI